jgi:hypothetical protein
MLCVEGRQVVQRGVDLVYARCQCQVDRLDNANGQPTLDGHPTITQPKREANMKKLETVLDVSSLHRSPSHSKTDRNPCLGFV